LLLFEAKIAVYCLFFADQQRGAQKALKNTDGPKKHQQPRVVYKMVLAEHFEVVEFSLTENSSQQTGNI